MKKKEFKEWWADACIYNCDMVEAEEIWDAAQEQMQPEIEELKQGIMRDIDDFGSNCVILNEALYTSIANQLIEYKKREQENS